MKYLFVCLLLSIGMTLPSFAQKPAEAAYPEHTTTCVLPAAPFQGRLYVPAKKGWYIQEKALNVTIDYIAAGDTLISSSNVCQTWPMAAQDALQAAVDQWSMHLESSRPITISACWTSSLGAGTLGQAGPSAFYSTGSPDRFIPVALYESIFNTNINGSNAEIEVLFNADRTNWYFPTDGNVPPSDIDFMTVAIHELGHGFGFLGVSQINCNGASGQGCIGFTDSRSGDQVPSPYSIPVETGNGKAVINGPLANPSVDIQTLLTGGNLADGDSGLFFAGSETTTANSNNPAKLYTPNTYSSGSTYSHFDLATFPNEVMKPILSSGQAIHDPGLAAQVLYDMGWSAAVLPVELLSFQGKVDQDQTFLHWITTNEINNSGFEVQRSYDGRNWETLEFVVGTNRQDGESNYRYADANPYRGDNFYRLLQVDFDGQSVYSDLIKLAITTDDQPIATLYPIPAKTAITVDLSTTESSLPYQVFDSFGRSVLRGILDGPRTQVEVGKLEPGLYIFKIAQTGREAQISFIKS